LFVTFGIYARRRHSWAFIAGLVIYGFDTLITLLGLMWLGIIWHGWAIYSLIIGLRAANAWRAVNRAAAAPPAPRSMSAAQPLQEAA